MAYTKSVTKKRVIARRRKTVTRRKSTRRAPVRRRAAMKRPGHKMTTMHAGPLYNSDRARVRMNIVEDEFLEELVATASTPQRLTYALNGIYDPYLGAGGGSVSGYTLMSTQYGFSMVKGSKIEVQVRRTIDTDQNSPYDVVVVPIPSAGSASLPTSIATLREQPYAKFIAGTAIGSDRHNKIVSYMSVTKIEGLKDIYAPSYRSTTGANPAIIPIWCIALQQADPTVASLSVSVIVSVKITYYVEWFNRYANPSNYLDKVLQRAADKGILDDIRKELIPTSPVEVRPKKYVKSCDHKDECKCVRPSIAIEDEVSDEEDYDLPAQTPGVPPHDQPVIPKELPPKALEAPGPAPDRAPTSILPPGGAVARRVRTVEASLDRRVSTPVVRK